MKHQYSCPLFILIIFILTLNCKKDNPVDTNADSQWRQVAGCPLAVRGSSTFSIENNAYVISGYTNHLAGNVWQYNSETNIWSSKNSFPGIGRLHAVGFSIGTKGYIATGMDESNHLEDFWEYDSQTDKWNQKPDFPGGKRAIATVLVINSKAYIIGGSASFTEILNKADVWEYDPVSDKWAQKSDFPGTGKASGSGFTIGNKGYFGIGLADSRDFWEYDPQTDKWTRMADFPGTARDEMVGFSIGNKGYLGCGTSFVSVSNWSFFKDFYRYDPQTNTWAKQTDFQDQVRTMALGFVIGSSGYFGAGATAGAQNLSDFWKFTP